jgi:uncharacterized membrane protein
MRTEKGGLTNGRDAADFVVRNDTGSDLCFNYFQVARLFPQMNTPGAKTARLESVDLLRGIVMILMALDHVRDFMGAPGVSPTNLAQATVSLFYTRWITNICAPVFFLLTGTGAYLSLRRYSRAELSRFLFMRGLWLIFLEVALLRCFALQFNFDYHLTMLVVIWALGWAMILLSALVYLPNALVTGLGVVMIAGHNLLDPVQAGSLGLFAPLWSFLHAPGLIVANPQHLVFVAYPLIPWVGVTAAGFGLGQIFAWPHERRKTFLLRLGIGLTTAFVVLRAVNVYGDPAAWTRQKTAAFTALSFLNTIKYPPSLLFLLMTLGPAMLLLWAFDSGFPRFMRPALILGRVPLFYYAMHLVLIHVIAVVVCYARYGQVHWMFESSSLGNYPITPPPGWGFSLPMVYLIWAFVVVALYPLCAWFARLKQRSRSVWLSYL